MSYLLGAIGKPLLFVLRLIRLLLLSIPLDYFPLENTLQMQLIDAFLADFDDFLGADIRKSSIASLWEDTRPDVTN